MIKKVSLHAVGPEKLMLQIGTSTKYFRNKNELLSWVEKVLRDNYLSIFERALSKLENIGFVDNIKLDDNFFNVLYKSVLSINSKTTIKI